eukprot:2082904-Pleurochrysis_carterae.AAC.6
MLPSHKHAPLPSTSLPVAFYLPHAIRLLLSPNAHLPRHHRLPLRQRLTLRLLCALPALALLALALPALALPAPAAHRRPRRHAVLVGAASLLVGQLIAQDAEHHSRGGPRMVALRTRARRVLADVFQQREERRLLACLATLVQTHNVAATCTNATGAATASRTTTTTTATTTTITVCSSFVARPLCVALCSIHTQLALKHDRPLPGAIGAARTPARASRTDRLTRAHQHAASVVMLRRARRGGRQNAPT